MTEPTFLRMAGIGEDEQSTLFNNYILINETDHEAQLVGLNKLDLTKHGTFLPLPVSKHAFRYVRRFLYSSCGGVGY